MKHPLHVHPHLTVMILACFGLASATAYFLLTVPRQLDPTNPAWLQAGASWATAFFAQCGVFLAVACSVGLHALSGRWSWSVRVFVAVSVYWGGSMAMLTGNAYQDARQLTGWVRTPAQFLEGAMQLASVFLLYLLFTVLTFVWVATRGRRLQSAGSTNNTSP